MKIVFFGSDDFAVPCLRALVAGTHELVCVVTQPDRKKGRGLNIGATPIKIAALKHNLNIYQPANINTPLLVQRLKSLKPDLFIVIAYGQLLSREILEVPKIFCLNMHASLLPNYRGAAPINWALINGEKETGITVIKMTETMDAGPVMLQKKAQISQDDTCISLGYKLAQLGAQLLVDALKFLENDNYCFTPQDKTRITFAPKLIKKNGRIRWNKPAGEIYNLIRGCLDWPGAFTYYNGKLLKIYQTKVEDLDTTADLHSTGEILEVSKKGIAVSCLKGNLIIEELQLEGKRKMTAAEFVAGHKISVGEFFGDKK